MNNARQQRMIREAWGPDYPNAVTAVSLVRLGLAFALITVAAVSSDLGSDAASVQVAHVEASR